MAFVVRQRRHIEDELRRIARKELRRARESLTKGEGVPSSAAVHDARKGVKKVRAVLAVLEHNGTRVRSKDRRRLQAAAHALSALRDREALVGTLDQLMAHFPKRLPEHTYRVIRRALVRDKSRAEDRARHASIAMLVAARLKKIGQSMKRWRFQSIDAKDFTAAIRWAYRDSRAGYKRAVAARESDETHRWRKRVKQLWYQLRLAQPMLPRNGTLVADLNRLQTSLGDEHNLLVLRTAVVGAQALAAMDREIAELSAMTVARQRQLQRKAFALGRRLHRRKPKAFVRALRRQAKRAPRAAAKAA